MQSGSTATQSNSRVPVRRQEESPSTTGNHSQRSQQPRQSKHGRSKKTNESGKTPSPQATHSSWLSAWLSLLKVGQPRKRKEFTNNNVTWTGEQLKPPVGVKSEEPTRSAGHKVYSNLTRLVMAFDIGTTYSGVSYCVHKPGRAPEIREVTKFPSQEQVSDHGKVPSLLYYDENGSVRAVGFEVLANVIEDQSTDGWAKAEWWKLRFVPEHLIPNAIDNLPPLPPGKSPVDVLTDFIKYLFQCAKTYIQERHLEFSWATVEPAVEYIFTLPNGWGEGQQQQYRQAIEGAELIPSTSEGRSRVHLLTEGEASLHFCVQGSSNATVANEVTPEGVVIIDAGGGTIDLSMFSMASNPISIAPAECRLQGSAFVTRRARALLQRKLEGWEYYDEVVISELTNEFDRSTKLLISNDPGPAQVKINVVDRLYNNLKYDISYGKLRLSSEEVTGLFRDSIDAIIDAFKRQQKSVKIPITVAYLVGGFSSNDWLLSQLEQYFKAKNIKIVCPNNNIKNAVARGAVICHIDRDNRLVASQAWRSVYDVIEHATQCLPVDKIQETFKFLHVQEWSNNRILKLDDEIQSLRAVLHAHEQKHQCEALYTRDHTVRAAQFLVEMINTATTTVKADKLLSGWRAEFTERCIVRLETIGDDTSNAKKYDNAIEAYSTALSLNPSASVDIPIKWANTMLLRGSVDDAMAAANKFEPHPKTVARRALCDVLERNGRTTEAIACFRQMQSEQDKDARFLGE